jgi:PAS domain S-box-containing protein
MVLMAAGFALVIGLLLLIELTHHDSPYHAYLNGLFALAALIAVSMVWLFGRRQNREELELRRLSSVVEHATDIIYITDPNGVIEYVNPGFERATGYSRAEAIGQTPRLVKSGQHDQAFFRELWKRISRTRGESPQGRFAVLRRENHQPDQE